MTRAGNRVRAVIAAVLVLLMMLPALGQDPHGAKSDQKVTIALLHLNDTYEIGGLRRNTVGGMARVATIRAELAKTYPNLLTLHAGDFLSPSALGNAKIDGKRIAGQHMVEVLKGIPVDYIIFGNHEFDLSPTEFEARLQELRDLRKIPDLKRFPNQALVRQFDDERRAIFSTNVKNKVQEPFADVPRDRFYEVRDDKGKVQVKIGFIGLTIDTSKDKEKDYAFFDDPIEAARRQFKVWSENKQTPDITIAITHQSLAADEELVREFPQIDLVIGGHEHENTHLFAKDRQGKQLAPIYRADANAVSVYVHELTYDPVRRRLERIHSNLRVVTDAIPDDPCVAGIVKKWTDRAFRAFREDGIEPDEVLTTTTDVLDGREAMVRNGETNLTRLIGDAMIKGLPKGDAGKQVAIYNSGSIRVDDLVFAGPITSYDVIRILPFLGDLWVANMKGERLKQILDRKDLGKGSGSLLQTRGVTADRVEKGAWLIQGKKLKLDETYQVAINSYLLEGNEIGFKFLKLPETVEEGANLGDWRQFVISHLRTMKGPRSQAK